MICAIALATHTHPDMWWDTDDTTLATVIELIEEAQTDGR